MAVAQNKAAFEWGRHCALHWGEVQALLAPAQVVQFHKPEGVDALIDKRVAFLTDYQNAAYANSYRSVVERVRTAEAALNKTTLTEAVARNLFKLMAYKDEYEVARLHTDTAFLQKIDGMFEGNFTLNYHLAPPLIAKTNAKGELQKQKFGPVMLTGFKVLKHFKWLRGTALDVFGYTEERRTERALIAQYQSSVDAMLSQLNADNHALAIEMARIPEQIKGFGHVKARHLAAARDKWNSLKAQWSVPT
jgi:indolepyruvate ferredoxin oxidoreductase